MKLTATILNYRILWLLSLVVLVLVALIVFNQVNNVDISTLKPAPINILESFARFNRPYPP